MSNNYFQFKQFIVHQDKCAMKVTTDGCLFGAWIAEETTNWVLGIRNWEAKSLLDIGTGTGLLSLMVAQKNVVNIDAVEIDVRCADQARENFNSSAWRDRLQVFHSNILELTLTRKYDIIICNPPFYENELSSPSDKRNIAHHSEELKMSEVIELISKVLKENGVFFLLIPFKREKEIVKLIADAGLYISKKIIVKQSVNHSPFRIMIMGINQLSDIAESELSIRDGDNNYTEEFERLLKSYYLYL